MDGCHFFLQMEAAGGGHVEVTQILLDHGAGTNNPSKDSKTIILHFDSLY